MSRPVRCEDCGIKLADMYDFAHGGERSQIVCFDCDPPKILCRECSRRHARCRTRPEDKEGGRETP